MRKKIKCRICYDYAYENGLCEFCIKAQTEKAREIFEDIDKFFENWLVTTKDYKKYESLRKKHMVINK